MIPKLTCYGGVGSVTGANFLLEWNGAKILVDCGLLQGTKETETANSQPFDYEPSSVTMLLVTHAHLDHVGRIGKLVKDGFNGVIYSTSQTKMIAQYIMEDAVMLLDKEARHNGVLPMYSREDVTKALTLWRTIEYHTSTQLLPGLSVYLKDAGHILGSAMIECSFSIDTPAQKKTTKLVFTGDLGNSPSPLLRDTESIEDADYVVMESVYGDRNHEPKDIRREKLVKIIKDAHSRQGTIIIPAFSVERTQVILYELNDLIETKQIPVLPVFVDSPLGSRVTAVYQSNTHIFNEAAQQRIKEGDDLFDFPRLKFVHDVKDSQSLDRIIESKIIIAGSGMSMGGRVRQHEATYLPDPRNTILLVGYQPIGTLGRQLQNGEKHVSIDGEKVTVKAHIESIFGYSAHKDSDHLVEFVSQSRKSIKKVFVVMGEPKASVFLSQRLHDEIDVEAICPERGKSYDLA